MHFKNSLLSLTFPKGGLCSNKVLQTGPDEPHSEAKPAELWGRGSLGPTEGLEVAPLMSPKHGRPQSPLWWAPDSPSFPSAFWDLGVSIAYPQGRPHAQGPEFPVTGPGPRLSGREQARSSLLG